MYVHVWMYMYMCTYVRVYAHTWRPEVNVRCLLRSQSTLFFRNMISYQTWRSSIQLVQLTHELLGSLDSTPWILVLEATETSLHQLLHRCWGWKFRPSCICTAGPCGWSPPPTSHWAFFKQHPQDGVQEELPIRRRSPQKQQRLKYTPFFFFFFLFFFHFFPSF